MTQRYDLNGPATITLWATYTYILMKVVCSGWLLWYNKTYSAYLANESGFAELAALNTLDKMEIYISLGFIAVTLIAYILNARWVYQASANAALAVPSDQRIRPNWAIFWYVIPIASLWMPYKAMKQTWAASVGGGVLETAVPGWFTFWWMSWVVLTIADTVGSNIGTSVTATPQDYLNGNYFYVVTGLLWTVPAVLFLRIVRDVTAHQGGAAEVFA